MSYLLGFPINTLKVDKSFVRRIGDRNGNLEIVQTIVRLEHTLSIDVIAEGIKTDFHLTQLNSLNCEFGQGYLFSKPLRKQKSELLVNRATVLFLAVNDEKQIS